MATVAAASCATSVTCFVTKSVNSKQSALKHVQGLPVFRGSRVTCSAEKKIAAVAATTVAATVGATYPAVAAVEDILGGEGTGLALGLNNGNLGWILAGVFTIIWSLFFVYSSKLPEGDDDTGLGL